MPLRQLRAHGQAQCPARAQVHVVLPRNLPHCTNRQSGSVVQRTQVLFKVSNNQHSQRVAAAAVDAPVAVAPEAPPEPKVPIEGVVCLPVTKNIKCLRGVCNERLKYEVEYSLKKGTSENSYLLKGGNGKFTVLLDVPFKAFAEDFVMSALSREVDPTDLSHVIITHVGPNRIPTLKLLLEAALAGRTAEKPLKIVASNPAQAALEKGLADVLTPACPVEWVKVKGSGEASIPITEAYSLTAMLTPTPRWPDAMCVVDPLSKVVFTSKLFSSHVAPGLLNTKAGASAFDVGGWEAYGDHWRYFFDCMLAPMAPQAQSALDKLPATATPRASLDTPSQFFNALLTSWGAMVADITRGSKAAAKASWQPQVASLFAYALAPQHGPVIRTSLSRLVLEYRRWTQEQVAALSRSNVVVLYASAYGNTAALAQAISRGLTKGGVGVSTVNLELTPLDEVVDSIKDADGFTIGSPTLGGHMPTPVQLALGSILRESKARELPCGVFGSFGWSGEAVDEMEAKLKDGGYGFAFRPIKVKFKPTATDLSVCEQSGRDLAIQVKRRLKNREKGSTSSMAAVAANSAQLAMGRVVGSLCVVTSRDEEAVSAMLASWVSQASFDPPGITIAVKKDRGMETMLQPGNAFAVSMVPESQEKPIMKAMTRPFEPGADRLASVPHKDSEVSGWPVIEGANAVLDCTVVSRMEAGDHWVVYGQVAAGKLNSEELTAVHHRKVGNHY
ncbi:flavodoxin-like protein [Scenedesmus sp. NREL 46B-D3]|nr:flavodoxin-like protein [Scenedesmus sp. NREL 46B-D3]